MSGVTQIAVPEIAKSICQQGGEVGPRNLIICCDGTGNYWKPGPDKTNVAKLFESLTRDDTQLAYYDPGVGTADGSLEGDSAAGLSFRDKLRRIGGLAWGDGVWQNVAEGYMFLSRNYVDGDRIFLIGFSRGAFTVRAISGLVHLFGLIKHEHENLIPSLLRVYRSRDSGFRTNSAQSLKKNFAGPDTPIHFIGCWDTVESVGVLQLLGAQITSNPEVKETFVHVRHAMAMDELRWPFKPRRYVPPSASLAKDDHRTYKQVWFRGAHSDVGGGYSALESGLSNTTLHWMAREAAQVGLKVDFNKLSRFPCNYFGMIHDEIARMPFWIIAGAFRRELDDPITVHRSVLERQSVDPYKGQAIRPNPLVVDTLDISGFPVPLDKSPCNRAVPPRQPVDRKIWISLLLSLAAFLGFGAQTFPESLDFATNVQLGLARDPFLSLSWALNEWNQLHQLGSSFMLRMDTWMILSYGVLAPLMLFFSYHVAYRTFYPSALAGKISCFGCACLPLADLLENWTTLDALRASANLNCGGLLVSCRLSDAFHSAAVSVLSGLKLASAFLLLSGIVVLWAQILYSRTTKRKL